ncbi:acetolactate synthase small subunit [bacterium]|nr:acetolactate synthase small subunit [bacterium]
MKRTLAVWFQNRFSAIPRITGLFSGRGFVLESICIGSETEDGLTRLTLTTRGDDSLIERIVKQLHRLIDVIQVVDLTGAPSVERELALIKVQSPNRTQREIVQLAEVFRGRIVDMGARSVTVEVTGRSDKIDAAIDRFKPFGVIEVSRTGTAALKRDEACEKAGRAVVVGMV